MQHHASSTARIPVAILAGGLGIAALLIAAITVTPHQAEATPAYAAQTKLGCGSCHSNPAGGGNLTARGRKFQANGHKL